MAYGTFRLGMDAAIGRLDLWDRLELLEASHPEAASCRASARC